MDAGYRNASSVLACALLLGSCRVAGNLGPPQQIGAAFATEGPAQTAFRDASGGPVRWQSHSFVVDEAVAREPTALGEVTSLDDVRFSEKSAGTGLWRPQEFARITHPGVYFLQPYDLTKMPVLFVHGINGSPANFTYLVNRLDRTRFQPWVYSYPSGEQLGAIADHLNDTMDELQRRYRFGPFAVVAHSMGGLVSRGFILRRARVPGNDAIPLFISISTPWDGHSAAEIGSKYVPEVKVWRDLVPGSDYLKSLFAAPLPAQTRYYLLFTFNRKKGSFGTSGDHTVTVASQLSAPAQQEAVRLIGYDDTHSGVLRDAAVSSRLNQLLDDTFKRSSRPP